MNWIKYLVGLLAVAASCSAVAAPLLDRVEVYFSSRGASTDVGDDGVMRFPHVQVVQQQTAPSLAAQGGFMAYKDPVTGQLTGPDPEQAALLTAAARAPAPLMRQVRPMPKPAQGGGVSLMLDELQVRYAVAHKAEDGSITHSCEPAAGEVK